MMQQITFYSGLSDLQDRYDSFIVDLWGVIHDGSQLFPNVLAALKKLSEAQKEIVFLSNSPRRSSILAKNLHELQIPDTLYKALYSSGEDAYRALKMPRKAPYDHLGLKAYVLSQPMHQGLYYDLDLEIVEAIENADFILNTGPQNFKPEEYQQILHQAVTLKLPMVCVNPDISVVHGGKLILCAGALAEYYQKIGGEVRYHGKPYPNVYQSVIEMFTVKDLKRTLAIGDSLITDIKGGNTFGIDTALVMTGLFEQEFGRDFDPELDMPKLITACHQKGVQPTYLFPQFQW
ncbi:hypothetical protein IM40_08890 [Candidatus Paracaedimonas acanthamoebae]|nr:hypothetical protein IM40_08890 [Candidatus Paracaedimonas acanthamoebae]